MGLKAMEKANISMFNFLNGFSRRFTRNIILNVLFVLQYLWQVNNKLQRYYVYCIFIIKSI